jgi:olefin beta-lactone synthetase
MPVFASANLAHLLDAAATEQGGRPAILRFDGHPLWRFADLAEAAARLAGGLQERGLQPGQRVALLTPEPARLYLAASALLWAGATVLLPPPTGTARERLAAVAAARPSAVVASPSVWVLAGALPDLRQAPLRITTGRWRLPGLTPLGSLLGAAPVEPAARAAHDPAIIAHTSGSTGQPREVIRTHGVLQAQHAALRALRPPQPGDLDLAGLPLLVLHNLASGVPSLLPSPGRWQAPGYGTRLRHALQTAGLTTAAGFPGLFEALVTDARPAELSGLRSIQVGGALVRPALLAALGRLAPAAELRVVYGCTEAEPIAAIGAVEYRAEWQATLSGQGVCVGQPVPGLAPRIAPLDGLAQPAGRLQVRGRHVATPPGQAAPAWLDTGDAGRLDQRGRLWLLGRCANVVDGLLPAEVEPAVEALPWVRAAALVGARRDGQPVALLAVEPERRPSPSQCADWETELEALARAHRWPLAVIEMVEHLPRDPRGSGKVDYPQLARQVGQMPQVASRPGTENGRR